MRRVLERETMIARYAGGERRAGRRPLWFGGRRGGRFPASATIAVLVSEGARVVPVASIEGSSRVVVERTCVRGGGSAKVSASTSATRRLEILESEVAPGSTVALLHHERHPRSRSGQGCARRLRRCLRHRHYWRMRWLEVITAR